MTEVFFQYKNALYLYDTEQLKLFEIKSGKLVEVNEPRIVQKVRLNSDEINKDQAFILANRFMKSA